MYDYLQCGAVGTPIDTQVCIKACMRTRVDYGARKGWLEAAGEELLQ